MFEITTVAPLKKALICLVALGYALALPNGAQAKRVAQAEKKELLGNVSGLSRQPSQTESKDGAAFVEKWLHAAQAYEDYSFDYKMTVFKNSGSTVTEVGKLSFKRPRLLRIEELGGPKAGSVAVLQADGVVRGHMGGGLKFFVASLSPDSSMLRSANGWPMCKSDFISLAEACLGYIKEGCTAKVTEAPVAVSEYANKMYDWQLYTQDGTIYKRALFDPNTVQPVEWWDYINGKLTSHSVWTNFKPNQGFSDKTFTVKGDK